jgi:hypothetical protein
MDGLLASVVLIAILLGVVLVIGGLGYLFARGLRKRSPEPMTMRPTPLLGSKPWYGSAPSRGEYGYSPASFEGHAVAVVGIGAAVYLGLAGQGLAAAAVAIALVIIVLVKSAPAGAREWNESEARRDQRPRTPVH